MSHKNNHKDLCEYSEHDQAIILAGLAALTTWPGDTVTKEERFRAYERACEEIDRAFYEDQRGVIPYEP